MEHGVDMTGWQGQALPFNFVRLPRLPIAILRQLNVSYTKWNMTLGTAAPWRAPRWCSPRRS
jgi:hypothetical protein